MTPLRAVLVAFLLASLDDTLAGEIRAWRAPQPRAGKAIKGLGDIARPGEAYPNLESMLPNDVARGLAGSR